jgi:hypothetical protein
MARAASLLQDSNVANTHTHTLAQRRVSSNSNRVWQSSLASSEARAIQLYLSESRQTLAQRDLP